MAIDTQSIYSVIIYFLLAENVWVIESVGEDEARLNTEKKKGLMALLSTQSALSVKTAGAAIPRGYAQPATSGVLIIESMPSKLRPRVEELMLIHLKSESTWEVSGEDPLTAQWCTRWHKDWPGHALADLVSGKSVSSYGVGCRQVVTGTMQELAELNRAVGELAVDYGFSAWVSM